LFVNRSITDLLGCLGQHSHERLLHFSSVERRDKPALPYFSQEAIFDELSAVCGCGSEHIFRDHTQGRRQCLRNRIGYAGHFRLGNSIQLLYLQG
jgi:hypothetical protein